MTHLQFCFFILYITHNSLGEELGNLAACETRKASRKNTSLSDFSFRLPIIFIKSKVCTLKTNKLLSMDHTDVFISGSSVFFHGLFSLLFDQSRPPF